MWFSVLLLLTIALFAKVKSEKLRISCNTNRSLNQKRNAETYAQKKQSHYNNIHLLGDSATISTMAMNMISSLKKINAEGTLYRDS